MKGNAHAIGQEDTSQQNVALFNLAAVVRSGAGLVIFLVGLLLLATATVMAATAIWNSGRYGCIWMATGLWSKSE